MSKTVEVSKDVAIEVRRLHDEIAMLRGLIEAHNAECERSCNESRESKYHCLDYARMGPHRYCGDCARDYMIDLPEQK